jgi:electron-transferring-flavoprotein dehydrogenase
MAYRNGRLQHAPSEFPPPVDSVAEFVKRGLDPEDELIEVGVAIVGGGTAGLACANRLLQLLGDDPELMEALGEVPVAVIEKAKTCGGHNLSGAVMRPGPLQELFPDMTREQWRKERFAFGEVTKEAVYMLPSASAKLRIPTPPPFKNHGNEIVSVSALARYQQRQAEEGGAYVLTETSAAQLIVQDGRVVGVRSGDKGRGKEGEELRTLDRRRDPRVRAGAQPRASGLGTRSQGTLEGPQAAGPGHPHDRPVAAEAVGQVRADRRHLAVSDEGRAQR